MTRFRSPPPRPAALDGPSSDGGVGVLPVGSLTSLLNNFGGAEHPTSLVRAQHPSRMLVVGPRRQEGEKLNSLAPGILQGPFF